MTKKERKGLRAWFLNSGPFHPTEAAKWLKQLWPTMFKNMEIEQIEDSLMHREEKGGHIVIDEPYPLIEIGTIKPIFK